MWKLLKKKFPKMLTAIPVGKKDRKGNIITNHEGLKHLYLQTYVNRLRNRPIKPDFEDIKIMKTELFELRLKLSKSCKSQPWKLDDLEKAIKGLKKDKARDPNGLVNEIFKDGVAGKDFKLSILALFNRMRVKNFIPDFVTMADVATIYKGKGEKCDLQNDRGIFLVTVFRSILMRMIYLEKYEELDLSMSDSQVGGRKGKSVRNHIWVLNGVICDVLSSEKQTPVDLQIFDYKQCFDTLWLQECMNDMFEGGIKDDKFALLYNVNTHVNVAVKTPVGKTKRGVITNAVIQGDVFGPMFCGKQVDEIGKECVEEGKYTYKYKGEVDIPPLSMIDDLISISECGHKTAMAHSYIKCKTSSKKLQFGSQKCKKIHIGKSHEEHKCQPLYVDKWEEKEVEDCETGIIKIEDSCESEDVMEEKSEEKYLGDVISRDGRNIKNIQSRVNKGTGIVRKILTILDGIPFGKYHFEAGIILRNSLLVSSVLFNSEAWYNITKAELELIETVDLMLLRGILKAPKSTPKEMLFLELGILPFREIIRKRRLAFLHYILHENKDSMISRVFETQRRNKTSKDWVTTVLSDLKEINLNMTLEEIRNMKKQTFINIIKRKIEYKSLKYLEKMKEKHSKVDSLKHPVIKMQPSNAK